MCKHLIENRKFRQKPGKLLAASKDKMRQHFLGCPFYGAGAQVNAQHKEKKIMNKVLNSKELSPEEIWNRATLANNFIFYKVMRHHPDACKKLIEMLLNIKIEEMEMHNEETIDLDHDRKGIRLDVFVKEENRMYDIELQVVNTKELQMRARYYAGLMALDSLPAGALYSKLRDSHVIFICMEDIFNHGLPVYSFENICREDYKLKLNDGDFKHFFIAPTCAKMIENPELKAFFELLITNCANSKFTLHLKDYVEDAKHNMQWRFQYMTYLRQINYERLAAREEGLQEGLEEGRAKGLKEGHKQGAMDKAIEAAKNLLKLNAISIEQIAQAEGLSVEKVEEIAREIEKA